MWKIKYILTFLSIILISSCKNENELTQNAESEIINNIFAEIEFLANSKECLNSSEWTFTSFGSKACGGPLGYIAYSNNIDTKLFLEKIETHRTLQKKYNEKWGIISNCSIPPKPLSIKCENGKPVLEY